MSKRRETRNLLDNLSLDPKAVVEVIGRLIGRATAHQHAAKQTPDTKKAEAHLSAANDLFSLAEDLAQATSEPALVKTNAAYGWAVARH